LKIYIFALLVLEAIILLKSLKFIIIS